MHAVKLIITFVGTILQRHNSHSHGERRCPWYWEKYRGGGVRL